MIGLFVTDLHGNEDRYGRLFNIVEEERPEAVLIGGDLLPRKISRSDGEDFLYRNLFAPIDRLESTSGIVRFLVILGNNDPKVFEPILRDAENDGLLEYINQRSVSWGDVYVAGYSYVPPTPFRLKDWERFDTGPSMNNRCLPFEKGYRSVPDPDGESDRGIILEDMNELAALSPPKRTVYLFHSPPFGTALDMTDMGSGGSDEAETGPVHIGSLAITEFIDTHQPLMTLHGHVHESTSVSGKWHDIRGWTHMLSAVHDGPELAVVRFDTDDPQTAYRELE